MRRLLALGLCLCLTGCTGNKYGDHPPYPATGQILVNGQPADDANIVLHHVGDWGEKSIVPMAWTDENGRFTLSTYAMDDGAPEGDYKVAIIWPAYRGKSLGPDKLGEKYANPETSGLKVNLKKGPNQLPFDLKGDPAQIKALAAQKPALKNRKSNR
jgi:hypothetical protein